LEKKPRGGDHTKRNNYGLTAEKLAGEYQGSPRTIESDATFAPAVDTLETEVSADLRDLALRRQRNGMVAIAKKRTVRSGKLVQERKVAPLPFMRRAGWKAFQVLEAIDILGKLPSEEHTTLNTFLDRPFLSPDEGLAVRCAHAHVEGIFPAWREKQRSVADPGKGLRCAALNAYGALVRTRPLPWECHSWPENVWGGSTRDPQPPSRERARACTRVYSSPAKSQRVSSHPSALLKKVTLALRS
jgi:hypothetical protein